MIFIQQILLYTPSYRLLIPLVLFSLIWEVEMLMIIDTASNKFLCDFRSIVEIILLDVVLDLMIIETLTIITLTIPIEITKVSRNVLIKRSPFLCWSVENASLTLSDSLSSLLPRLNLCNVLPIFIIIINQIIILTINSFSKNSYTKICLLQMQKTTCHIYILHSFR